MNDHAQTLVVDGHYFLHRVLHLPDVQRLATSDGRRTGGVFGVFSSIRKSLEKFPNACRCVVTWDCGRSMRRKELLPEYKANRDVVSSEEERIEKEQYKELFDNQLELLQSFLPLVGVRQALLQGKEGDDIIGWVVRNYPNCVVVTEDKDLLQVVAEGAKMWMPMKETLATPDNFREVSKGISPEYYLAYKSLLGDPSDNIPGIPQVGPKTIQGVILSAMGITHGRSDVSPSEYVGLITDACEMQPRTKGGKLPAKVQRLLDGLDIFERNLKLTDVTLEEFNSAEEACLHAMVAQGATYFREHEALKFVHSLEMQSVLDWWTQNSHIFRKLR